MRLGGRFIFWLACGYLGTACAITATRPVQEMSNTQAALKAAKEVQADVLAPELYRQATEWFLKARQEYRYKDFEKANDYALRARQLSEQAEFEALKNGGVRGGNPDTLVDEPPPPPAPPAAPLDPNAAPPGDPMQNAPATPPAPGQP